MRSSHQSDQQLNSCGKLPGHLYCTQAMPIEKIVFMISFISSFSTFLLQIISIALERIKGFPWLRRSVDIIRENLPSFAV
jgi:hypothetical protein